MAATGHGEGPLKDRGRDQQDLSDILLFQGEFHELTTRIRAGFLTVSRFSLIGVLPANDPIPRVRGPRSQDRHCRRGLLA
jgi:hypothetical protein